MKCQVIRGGVKLFMKIKHRILSILLVFSLLFSLPIAQITSYADTPTLGTPGDGMQDNTASGGETEYNPGNPSKGEIAQAVEAEAKWWISPFKDRKSVV